ncbi:MAG: hypothetical protein ISR34_12010 [Pirellulales bacterium]|nr:hypothetical protein [Pirellulales bacterium]
MDLQQLLETHIMDPKNPLKIYNLAKEYDRLENGAMGVSLYLKTADMSKDPELQYKSLIGIARCYDRQRDRNYTTEGSLLDAAALLPNRPEAHYHLCAVYEKMNNWKKCLLHANLGLNIEDLTPNEELGFPGKIDLEYYQALAKWSITAQQDGKQLFFNLKHKRNLRPDLLEKVNLALKWNFYPDVIPYEASDIERFKFSFDGIEEIKNNYSKHFQDMFVLSAFRGKRNGSYLEIGSGDPHVHNNTALLEEQFGWKGISIDNSEALCYEFKQARRNTVICADATDIDYTDLFQKHCVDNKIDYLQIDCDELSISVLELIPLKTFKFGVITFEHDSYRLGTDKKFAAKKILEAAGYICAVPNVGFHIDGYPYEDWYYHPDVVDMPQEMKSKKDVNFIWDYMMGPIKEEE